MREKGREGERETHRERERERERERLSMVISPSTAQDVSLLSQNVSKVLLLMFIMVVMTVRLM